MIGAADRTAAARETWARSRLARSGRASLAARLAATLIPWTGAIVLAGCVGSSFDDGSVQTSKARSGSSTSTTVPALPTSSTPAPAGALVDRLVVRPTEDPALPPYRRDAFGEDWDYDPSTGCNTRERVLIAESLVPATVDDRCHPSAGRWRSSYDGVVTTDPADLQIDHLVALADAWRSGAWRWDDARRLAFANDVEHPEALAAVTGSSNQSKGDSAPDGWLPPQVAARCPYATAWVEVKARWQLTVTPAEKAALVSVLSGC